MLSRYDYLHFMVEKTEMENLSNVSSVKRFVLNKGDSGLWACFLTCGLECSRIHSKTVKKQMTRVFITHLVHPEHPEHLDVCDECQNIGCWAPSPFLELGMATADLEARVLVFWEGEVGGSDMTSATLAAPRVMALSPSTCLKASLWLKCVTWSELGAY